MSERSVPKKKAVIDLRFAFCLASQCGLAYCPEMGKKSKKRKSKSTGLPPSLKQAGPGLQAIRQLTQGWTVEGLFRELRKIDHAEAERRAKAPRDCDVSF